MPPTLTNAAGLTQITIARTGGTTTLAVALGGTVRIAAVFAAPLDVPAGLTKLTQPQINELQGKFGTNSLIFSSFCGAALPTVAINGDLQVLFKAGATVIDSITARLRFASNVGGGTVSFAVRITDTACTLALHCEDLLLELPEIDFPGLDFAGMAIQPLPPPGGAPLPLPLLPNLAVAFAYTNGAAVPNACIAYGLAASGVPTAKLTNAAGAQIGLTATLSQGGAPIGTLTLPNLAFIGAQLVIGPPIVAPAPQPFTPPPQFLGPLRITCSGTIELDPTESAPPNPKLALKLVIDSLTVTATDDPGALIEFKGTVYLSPARIWVDSVALVQPSPLQLTSLAREQAERLTGGMSRLVFSAASGAGDLLAVLARIGASAGRARLGVPGIGTALTGVAQTVDVALRALTTAAGALDAEILFAAAPFRLRQIRISPLTLPAATGLLTLTLDPSRQLGLLIDFATAPGVYLCALPSPGGPGLCVIETGLWLGDAATATTSALPANASDGTLVPCLSIALGLPAGRAQELIVLAGYGGGKPHLFQAASGPMQSVARASGARLLVQPNGFALTPIEDLVLTGVTLRGPDPVNLPLLGAGAGSSVSLILQGVTNPVITDRSLSATLNLYLTLDDLALDLPLDVKLSLEDFRLSVDAGPIPILHEAFSFDAFGLSWRISPEPKKGAIFELQLFGGESQLSLAPGATMQALYTEASPGGEAITFSVSRFSIGRAGLTVSADINDQTVPLNGLSAPFRLTNGRLAIERGRLLEASVAGSGVLPRELVGEASASISLRFAQASNGAISLKEASASLDLGTAPITCPAIRFTLSLTHIDLDIINDGGVHFYFALTGSARFTPAPGEFDFGLLGNLGNLEITLDKMPLASDARVLAKHISFQVEMAPPKDIDLFDLFSFEVRSIGFHPSLDAFDGAPAVRIGGQISFSLANDVVNPSIDFHGLMIAPPAAGQILPRVRCDELSVDLVLEGGIIIGATVAAADAQSATLDSRTPRPANFNESGFLGAGRLSIPGFAAFTIALGFVEAEFTGPGGGKGLAFFLYAEMKDVAYRIDTPIWPLFIRQIGLGMGSNFTLASIALLDGSGTPGQVIANLDQLSRKQNNLGDPSVWQEDFDPSKPARITLVGRLAVSFTADSPEDGYIDDKEKPLPNPIFFDLVLALRSDLTLFASLRVWIAVNYSDFRTATAAITEAPPLRGYLEISAPRHELLARMLNDPQGYIGKHPDFPDVLRRLLGSVKWSALLYMSPNLLQAELGWPNQCSVQLANEPDFRAVAKGGMAFRVADGLILFGANFEADATFHFGGSVDLGFAGVSADATLNAGFSARLVSCIDTRRPLKSLYYVAFALHASLDISVSAWLRIDLAFTSFTINISFSVSLQISASVELALEIEGIAIHADAKIGIGAFGFTAMVPISLTVGSPGVLGEARALMARFMSMSLTADILAQDPADQASANDKNLQTDATSADQSRQIAQAPPPAATASPIPAPPITTAVDIAQARFGQLLAAGTFNLALRRAEALPTGTAGNPADYFYAFVMPADADSNGNAAFFAPPPAANNAATFKSGGVSVAIPVPALPDYVINFGSLGSTAPADILRFDPVNGNWIPINTASDVDAASNWASPDFATPVAHGYLFDAKYTQAALGPPATDPFYTVAFHPLPPPARPTEGGFWFDPPPVQFNRPNDQEDAAALAAAQRAARAAADFDGPARAAARQARSLFVAQLFEDVETIATSGAPAKTLAGNTGLVFLIPSAAVGDLVAMHIKRAAGDGQAPARSSPLNLINPVKTFFEQGSVALANLHWQADPEQAGAGQGLHLGWTLEDLADPKILLPDTGHFLHHYEITRGIGNNPALTRTERMKPVSLAGALDSSTGTAQTLHPPLWQYTDDLADLTPLQRAAILGTVPADDPTEIMAAWSALGSHNFTPIDITYMITPVDVAGTAGDPHALVCRIPHPAVPARPAEAVLLLELDGIPAASPTRPQNLRLTLGIFDQHWNAETSSPNETRLYQLIAEPEEIVPSGFYAADAQTSRLQSSPSSAVPVSADAFIFTLTRTEMEYWALDPNALGLPADFAASNPPALWAWIAGQSRSTDTPGNQDVPNPGISQAADTLLDALWRAKSGRRCGVKFSLRTLRRVGGLDFTSNTVPVTLEIRVLAKEPNTIGFQTAQTLRPPIFEWPVTLELPALGPTEITGSAGLLQLLAPKAGDGFANFLSGDAAYVPDPEHRVVTNLRFAAHGAALDDDAAAALAAFDVLELNLDAVAKSGNLDLASDGAAWAAARRIARAQIIRTEEAMLEPGGLGTLARWHARYPSDVARARRPAAPLADWFSTSETMPAWPKPRLRNRLLPLPEEAAITSLFAQGSLYALQFTVLPPQPDWQPICRGTVGKALEIVQLLLVDIPLFEAATGQIKTVPGNRDYTIKAGLAALNPTPDGRMTALLPCNVRQLFLQLAWCFAKPAAGDYDWHAAYADNPAQFNGFSLGVTPLLAASSGPLLAASADALMPGTQIVIPLDLGLGMHPALEETIGLLRYAYSPNAAGVKGVSVYLRHQVQAEPPPPVSAANCAAFLAATSPVQDPYGWGVLQSLGLAVSFRLLDQHTGLILPPEDLLARVQASFDAVLANYNTPRSGRDALDAGAPFADILLRPGADRRAHAFDEISADPADTKVAPFDALALVQLSLRPLRAPVAKYWIYKIPLPTNFNGTDLLVLTATTVQLPAPQVTWSAPLDAVMLCDAARGVAPTSQGDDGTISLTVKQPRQGTDQTGLYIAVRRWTQPSGDPELTDAAPDILVKITLAQGDYKVDAEWGTGAPSLRLQASSLRTDIVMDDALFAPLGKFVPLGVAALTDHLLGGQDPARQDSARQAAWDNFGAWLAARSAALTLPVDQLPAQALVSLLTGWGKRFIDYGQCVAPPSTGASYAIAAPEIAFPWKIAPDAAGWLTLSFLSEARWGRSCAYAVQPLSRWLNLQTALGTPPPSPVPDAAGVLGYQVTRIRRMQKPAAPALFTRAQDPDDNFRPGFNDLIIRRPAEQFLAESNRRVASGLEFQGLARSYALRYLYANWLAALAGVLVAPPPDPVPSSLLLAPSRPVAPEPDVFTQAEFDELAGLNSGALGAMIAAGASVYRHDPTGLPPFYDILVLVTAPAGVNTSPIATALLGRGRSELSATAFASRPPSLAITRPPVGAAKVTITIPLLRHRDCMAANWNFSKGSIADVPEPDAVYLLSLTDNTTSEDIAELRAVPYGKAFNVENRSKWFSVDPALVLSGAIANADLAASITLSPLSAPLGAPLPQWMALPGGAVIPVNQADWLTPVEYNKLTLPQAPVSTTQAATGPYIAQIQAALTALAALNPADLLKPALAAIQAWLKDYQNSPAANAQLSLDHVPFVPGWATPPGFGLIYSGQCFLRVEKAPGDAELAAARAVLNNAYGGTAESNALRDAARQALTGGYETFLLRAVQYPEPPASSSAISTPPLSGQAACDLPWPGGYS